MLLTILEHLYSCLFGTFLYNTDKERKDNVLHTKTLSLWDFIYANAGLFINKNYSPSNDVYYPSLNKIQLWSDYYMRWTIEGSSRCVGDELSPIGFTLQVE